MENQLAQFAQAAWIVQFDLKRHFTQMSKGSLSRVASHYYSNGGADPLCLSNKSLNCKLGSSLDLPAIYKSQR